MLDDNNYITPEPQEKFGLKEELIIEPTHHSINRKESCFKKFYTTIFPCLKRVDITSRRFV